MNTQSDVVNRTADRLNLHEFINLPFGLFLSYPRWLWELPKYPLSNSSLPFCILQTIPNLLSSKCHILFLLDQDVMNEDFCAQSGPDLI